MMIVLMLTSISDWNRSKAPNAETSLSVDGRDFFETPITGMGVVAESCLARC
jgi:hypothetical protein